MLAIYTFIYAGYLCIFDPGTGPGSLACAVFQPARSSRGQTQAARKLKCRNRRVKRLRLSLRGRGPYGRAPIPRPQWTDRRRRGHRHAPRSPPTHRQAFRAAGACEQLRRLRADSAAPLQPRTHTVGQAPGPSPPRARTGAITGAFTRAITGAIAGAITGAITGAIAALQPSRAGAGAVAGRRPPVRR